ncbi:MAG: DUF2975 domain-containing protein [Ruminococcaceae bacterium]|nr:DUF2975 domain-containing protein [Oscillospiraceae bacterium]
MNRKNLSVWLKAMIICVGACGALIYALVLPITAGSLEPFANDAAAKYLWLIFLWVSGVPCYAVLAVSWLVCGDIEKDRAFTAKNSKRLKIISILAGADTLFLFLGNIALLIFKMNNLFMMAFCVLVAFLGIVLSVAFAALSHLVARAAELQEECDLTI